MNSFEESVCFASIDTNVWTILASQFCHRLLPNRIPLPLIASHLYLCDAAVQRVTRQTSEGLHIMCPDDTKCSQVVNITFELYASSFFR